MSISRIITTFIVLLIVSSAIIFFWQARNDDNKPPANQLSNKSTNNAATDQPSIISTKPDPLDQAIVSATEVLEFTFNTPLQNAPEFKTRIDPEIEYKVELAPDRKTAKIIFQKPLELGTAYTLFILPESKFDGGGKLNEEKIFHFKTITYRGV